MVINETDKNIKILIKDLEMTFKSESGMNVEAIKGINLKIYDKEFISIIGPSGCGKTTVLNLIAGLIFPTKGSILLDDVEVKGPDRDRGCVFQVDTVFMWRRVEDNIGYGLEIAGVPKKERQKIVESYLNMVGLTDFRKLYPKELSGGMRKRVSLAMVLANNPKVLLMDEPFGALDYPTKIRLQNELLSIWDLEKRTTIFVTHDIEEALFVADRIVVLINGKINEEYIVPFKRPRVDELRFDREFENIKHKLWKYLR